MPAGVPDFQAPLTTIGTAPTGDNATGEPSVSAATIARAAAAAALANQPTVETITPGSTFHEGRPTPLPQDDPTTLQPAGQTMQPVQPAPQEQPQGAPATPAAEVVEDVMQRAPADWQQLTEAFGISTPADFDAAPAHIQDAYSEVAQIALDRQRSYEQALREARISEERIADFAKRLAEPDGQKRVILSLAATSPEVFQEAVKTYERMQADPEYAAVVKQNIEAQMQLEAMQRAQRVGAAVTQETKGQQVESRVERLAERLGIDAAQAKEQVVNKILRNQAATGKRDITFEEVDQVVNEFAKLVGKAPRQQPVRQPAAQARQQQAPQVPAAAAPTPAPQPAPTAPKLPASPNALDKLRLAIHHSAQTARNNGL